MIRFLLIVILSLPLAGIPHRAFGQTPDDEDVPRSARKPPESLIVAKGPCKKIEGKFEVGMKLFLMTDHRLIGEVTVYRPSHLFPDGKSREAVKVKLPTGKSTWLPVDTARRIYVTQ